AGPGFGNAHSGSVLLPVPVPGPTISPSQPARDTSSKKCSPLRTRVLRSNPYAYLGLHIFNYLGHKRWGHGPQRVSLPPFVCRRPATSIGPTSRPGSARG